MYFSKHNKNITYINHYSGLLEVKGEGVLCREDTELWHESGKNWAKEYDTLSVTEGITGLGEGYIEFFSHIDCLILSRTVESIAASPEFLKRWRKSKVLIRGEYNTFAERFAGENGLGFLHSDIHLADDDIEVAHDVCSQCEWTVLELVQSFHHCECEIIVPCKCVRIFNAIMGIVKCTFVSELKVPFVRTDTEHVRDESVIRSSVFFIR